MQTFDLSEYSQYGSVNIFNFYGPVYGDVVGFLGEEEEFEVENVDDSPEGG